MEDTINTLLGLLPERWAAVIGALFALLVAVRGTLLALSVFLKGAASALDLVDLAIDGHSDWKGLSGRLADAARWIDRGIQWSDKWLSKTTPVQIPVLRGAYELALPKARRP